MNKNTVLILIVVVCLLGAGIFLFMQMKGGKKTQGPTTIGPASGAAAPAPGN